MESATIGYLAQLVTVTSIIPYLIGIIKGNISPNRTSWFIWSLIGFSFLLTTSKIDPIIFMYSVVLAFNPALVFILTFFYKSAHESMTKWDKIALITAISAMILWFFTKDVKGLEIWPIVLVIVADASALIPTILFVRESPGEDRPSMWILFVVGAILVLVGIDSYSSESLALPLYMTVGPLFVIYPLVKYRVLKKIPLREWV